MLFSKDRLFPSELSKKWSTKKDLRLREGNKFKKFNQMVEFNKIHDIVLEDCEMSKRIKYHELKLMHIWRVSVFHRVLLIVFFCNIHQRKTSVLYFTFCIIESGKR